MLNPALYSRLVISNLANSHHELSLKNTKASDGVSAPTSSRSPRRLFVSQHIVFGPLGNWPLWVRRISSARELQRTHRYHIDNKKLSFPCKASLGLYLSLVSMFAHLKDQLFGMHFIPSKVATFDPGYPSLPKSRTMSVQSSDIDHAGIVHSSIP
jgi:hypothetical protein